MDHSLSFLLALALAASASAAVGADLWLRRRLRRPRLLQACAIGPAAVLVPLLAWCCVAPSAPPAVELAGTLGALGALTAAGAVTGRTWIATQPARAPRRVLAIGAHPDDLELGCGGTLAKLADSGHEVQALVMCSGERGGDARRRPEEARSGGRFLRVVRLHVLQLPDTRLADVENDMTQVIETLVRRMNPDIIFTHSSNDQHQDHAAVHRSTLRAARRHSTILCYESPSVTASFTPSVFVDIEGYVGVKSRAVAAHADQAEKPYMTAEHVATLARFRGGQAKVRDAEGYEPVRLLGNAARDIL